MTKLYFILALQNYRYKSNPDAILLEIKKNYFIIQYWYVICILTSNDNISRCFNVEHKSIDASHMIANDNQ